MAITGLLLAYSLAMLLRASSMDPGIIPRREPDLDEGLQKMIRHTQGVVVSS
jgi:hypothetical protein